MSIGLLFWILMIFIVLFGFVRDDPRFASYGWGWNWILYILLFLLGWHDFGFVIHP